MPQITQLAEVLASQLFWLAIFFGLIFFVIARGMLPKVRSTIDDRDAKVAEDLKQAQAARTGAEQTEAAWRERMDATRQDAARLAQEAKLASARETEARIKEALDEIDARVERARLRIRDAVASARAEMEVVATDAAQQMVQQLTGIKVEKKEASIAIEAQLADMHLATPQRAEMPSKHIVS
jgi:F-type H+-transporting ATPase subunit b